MGVKMGGNKSLKEPRKGSLEVTENLFWREFGTTR